MSIELCSHSSPIEKICFQTHLAFARTAGLDVFGNGVAGKPDLEPLPADHPLWDCP
jgi:hypothetical protein